MGFLFLLLPAVQKRRPGTGPSSRRSVNFDPYSTFFYLHWIYSNILSQGFAQGFSGPHVEPALMQRALDFMIFQKTVTKARMPVRTDVVGRVDLAFHVVKRQLPAFRIYPDNVVLGHVVARQHINPVCHWLYSFSFFA